MSTFETLGLSIGSSYPVYLISASYPGSGSTTLAESICTKLGQDGLSPQKVLVGQALRASLGVQSDSEMLQALKKIPDPTIYDEGIYSGILTDRPVVVEGKLATTAGPAHISGRPVITIDLVSDPITSTARLMRREGHGFDELMATGRSTIFLDQYYRIIAREKHIRNDKAKLGDSPSAETTKFVFDASFKTPDEITAELLYPELDFTQFVPEWEVKALIETLAELSRYGILLAEDMPKTDRAHFAHNTESILYNIDRLKAIRYPDAIKKIRDELKKSITDAWIGLSIKRAPRFFHVTETDGQEINTILQLDNESSAWTPDYYKLAESWPVLTTLLDGKSILDPFSGPGSLVNFLAAREIPSSIICSDISYPGGLGLNGAPRQYAPELNRRALSLFFDLLPSWYKPKFNQISGYVTADARNVPLIDGAVDYVLCDPPYGINCEGGCGLFLRSIDELLRVSREGIVAYIPESWLDDIKGFAPRVTQLTNDLSNGNSGLPVVMIRIEK